MAEPITPLPPGGQESLNNPPAPPKPQAAAAVAAIFGLAGLSFYFMFTYTGPFQWLAELQLKWLELYSEKLTLILTMLVLMLPAIAFLQLVKVAMKTLAPGRLSNSTGSTVIAGGASGRKAPDFRIPQWVIFPFLGVIALAIGGYMYWRGATAGPLTEVSVKDLEDGKKPASSYLTVEGVPLWKALVSFGDTSKKCYVPLVSRDWKGEAVAVYLECGDDDVPRVSDPLEMKTFKGMKATGGLPGPVRVSFEKSAFKPAAGYLMIETREEPAKLMGFGKWPMIAGAGLILAGFVVWAVKRILARGS